MTKVVLKNKFCENIRCGKEFTTGKSYKIFCSKKCRLENWSPNRKESNKRYGELNKERKKKYDSEYYVNNSEKIKERSKNWRNNNKALRWEKEKAILEANPQKKLYKRIQTLLKRYLTKSNVDFKNVRTLNMLGFSLEELEQHLKSTMKDGMTWDQFLNGEIHIDHIKPHSLFKYSSVEDEDFKKCWSLNNLQLLYKIDNLKKQNKWSA